MQAIRRAILLPGNFTFRFQGLSGFASRFAGIGGVRVSEGEQANPHACKPRDRKSP
jgi:hypothetical protein